MVGDVMVEFMCQYLAKHSGYFYESGVGFFFFFK